MQRSVEVGKGEGERGEAEGQSNFISAELICIRMAPHATLETRPRNRIAPVTSRVTVTSLHSPAFPLPPPPPLSLNPSIPIHLIVQL